MVSLEKQNSKIYCSQINSYFMVYVLKSPSLTCIQNNILLYFLLKALFFLIHKEYFVVVKIHFPMWMTCCPGISVTDQAPSPTRSDPGSLLGPTCPWSLLHPNHSVSVRTVRLQGFLSLGQISLSCIFLMNILAIPGLCSHMKI